MKENIASFCKAFKCLESIHTVVEYQYRHIIASYKHFSKSSTYPQVKQELGRMLKEHVRSYVAPSLRSELQK